MWEMNASKQGTAFVDGLPILVKELAYRWLCKKAQSGKDEIRFRPDTRSIGRNVRPPKSGLLGAFFPLLVAFPVVETIDRFGY